MLCQKNDVIVIYCKSRMTEGRSQDKELIMFYIVEGKQLYFQIIKKVKSILILAFKTLLCAFLTTDFKKSI